MLSGVVVLVEMVLSLATSGAIAAERDLESGLAHLRIGAQAQAEQDLSKYRDEERNPEIRKGIDRVLPLLKQTLSEEVREYIARTIEADVRAKSKMRRESSKPSYWSRMFPVFP